MGGRGLIRPCGSLVSRNTSVSTTATTRLMTSAVSAIYPVWFKTGTYAVDAPKCEPGTPGTGVF